MFDSRSQAGLPQVYPRCVGGRVCPLTLPAGRTLDLTVVLVSWSLWRFFFVVAVVVSFRAGISTCNLWLSSGTLVANQRRRYLLVFPSLSVACTEL